MREPSPTRRLSPVGTDKHVNHHPQRMDYSEWAQRDGGESVQVTSCILSDQDLK